jgi:hypothetical protein
MLSLGSATHTRVDSAAKHIRQCKVHERLMQVLSNVDQETVHREKNKYATMKDDLVLNVNQSLGRTCNTTDAYPSVMSNFTSLNAKTKDVIAKWYTSQTALEFYAKERFIQLKTEHSFFTPDTLKDNKQCDNLPFFRAQGYALGRAEANMRSGDTVFSVLIGGQMTVQNGDFPMRPGQMVQWYFDFERDGFHADGRRDTGVANKKKMPNEPQSKRARLETNAQSTCVALPKPYVLNADGTDHYGDKIRIFAKCICGGPPSHKVDIMLMTQSH